MKWQKKNAVLELGIAFFGMLSMLSYSMLGNKLIFLLFAVITLLFFFLSISNEKNIRK